MSKRKIAIREGRVAWNYGEQLRYMKVKHGLDNARLAELIGCHRSQVTNFMKNAVLSIPADGMQNLLNAFNIENFEDVDTNTPFYSEEEHTAVFEKISDGWTDELRLSEFALVNPKKLKKIIEKSKYSIQKLSIIADVGNSTVSNMIYRGEGHQYIGLTVERVMRVLNTSIEGIFELSPKKTVRCIPRSIRDEYKEISARVGNKAFKDNIRRLTEDSDNKVEEDDVIKTLPKGVFVVNDTDDDEPTELEKATFKANMNGEENITSIEATKTPKLPVTVSNLGATYINSMAQSRYDKVSRPSNDTIEKNIQAELIRMNATAEQINAIMSSISTVIPNYTYDQVMDKVEVMKRRRIFPQEKNNNLILLEILEDIEQDDLAQRYNEAIALRIKDRRAERYIGIEELAKETKLTTTKLRKYESGIITIPYEILVKIACALNVSVEYLITGRGEKESW